MEHDDIELTHEDVFAKYQPPPDGWLTEAECAAALNMSRSCFSYLARSSGLTRKKRKGFGDRTPVFYYEPRQLGL